LLTKVLVMEDDDYQLIKETVCNYKLVGEFNPSWKKHQAMSQRISTCLALFHVVLDANKNPVDYIFVDASPAFAELTAFDISKIKGKGIESIFTGLEFIDLSGMFAKVVASDSTTQLEFESMIRGKPYRIAFYSPSQDKIIASFTSISSRKHAEKALRITEKQRDLFLSNFQGIAYMKTLDLRLTLINKMVEKITGYSREEFMSGEVDWNDILHPNDRLSYQQAVKRTVTIDNHAEEIEYRILRKDNAIRWVYEYQQNIVDESGMPFRLHGVVYDVTERKIAEERLNVASSCTSDFVYEWTIPEDNIQWFGNKINTTDCANVYFPQSLDNWLDLVHPDDRKYIEDSMRKSLETSGSFCEEYRIMQKDGTFRYWKDCGMLIPAIDGLNNRFIGACTDITGHKEAEQALFSAHLAEKEANRAKSQFLATMSHELRTPLNSIIGFSEMLMTGLFGNLTEKQNDYVENISCSGYHLLDIINDILDISKIENGKMELDPELFNVCDVVNETIALLLPVASSNGLDIFSRVGKDVDCIRADRLKLKQILSNLLSNAIKFTPPGGNVSLSVEKESDQLLFSVVDTGIGIPEDKLENIFNPFVRVGKFENMETSGTGLGLAIVREMVHLHGGVIHAESESAKGSSFKFKIPIECQIQP